MIKSIILVGGPQKGTRFRPLSFNCPKPLFPIAGLPMIEHLIRASIEIPDMEEILLIGFYQLDDSFTEFIQSMTSKYQINIRYLQEYAPLGTAGGIYHFRDMICLGDPEVVFLFNGDVCGNFDLISMLEFHRSHSNQDKLITILATEATRQQSLEYGCIVKDKDTHEMLHYVEKPGSFISTTINCGVYILVPRIMNNLSNLFKEKHKNSRPVMIDDTSSTPLESLSLENDVLKTLTDSRKILIHQQSENFWWTPIKTPSSAIYANRNYLCNYRKYNPELLYSNSDGKPEIIGDVYIDPTAVIDPTAKIGPNVSISEGVRIGAGVRIKESIVLKNVIIKNHSLIMYSVLGWNCSIGHWSRVEGTPCDPNPDRAFSKMENFPLFDCEGKLNPLITVLATEKNRIPSHITGR
ncbi:Mannose-1-phosphate guanyltransferase alpha-B [Sarcoptes scabiei]|uniref:Mannose-1-phosphate guanyltransferase alpha-B n=1 Tax=Sarcoptes scabiei TaxID=52283 RepID=A0A834VD16_SARSC|nr:Mannose-1-phosphate guanyltransferase alpha-B [Sarcoptes scabiei]